MKLRPAFFLLCALAAFGGTAGALRAETPTESKVRLMSEALAARDKGDYPAARLKLEALLVLAPNDAGVHRLMADLETRQAAEESARAAQLQAAATAPPPPEVSPEPPRPAVQVVQSGVPSGATALTSVPTESANATLMTVPVITEGRPSPAAPSNLPEGYAAALARVEAAGVTFAHSEGPIRLEKLMIYVQAQRDLARLYARDGNYPLAMSTLDAAIASLKTSVNDLRSEREEYERQDQLQKEGVRLRHHH
jgi:tetratricopeptide (TPR) repeat protein